MSKNHNQRRTWLAASLIALAGVFLVIVPMSARVVSIVTPQGKGGTVKPVPTPTPIPKKVTTKKSTTPSGRGNTNQTAKSKEDEAAASERTYWETIRNSTDPEDFRAYLKRYPNGVYADLANNRIKALEAAAKPQPSATPAPTPEPAYEWTKAERDLPASVRLEWNHEKNLSFSVPSGWMRTQREEKVKGTNTLIYLQLSFRAPDSPLTNISVQLYNNGYPHTLTGGAAELWREEKILIDYRRNQYASQNLSAKLTADEVINHPTGRWHTFTADVLDVRALDSLVKSLDAVYPDEVWEKNPTEPGFPERFRYTVKRDSLGAFTRTRHSYAIRQAGADGDFIVMLYTAPIDQFDEKMLPSVMATLKVSGGTIRVVLESSDSSVSISNSDREIVIDGERKGAAGNYERYSVSAGKHHITVRAKEHKPFEKDVFVGGWEDQTLEVKLERIKSSTSAVKPNQMKQMLSRLILDREHLDGDLRRIR